MSTIKKRIVLSSVVPSLLPYDVTNYTDAMLECLLNDGRIVSDILEVEFEITGDIDLNEIKKMSIQKLIDEKTSELHALESELVKL